MKPYSIGTKTRHNFTDCHPKKGWENWWEYMSYGGSKTSTRMKAKQKLKNFDLLN